MVLFFSESRGERALGLRYCSVNAWFPPALALVYHRRRVVASMPSADVAALVGKPSGRHSVSASSVASASVLIPRVNARLEARGSSSTPSGSARAPIRIDTT